MKTCKQRTIDELAPVLRLRVELLVGTADKLAVCAVVNDNKHILVKVDPASCLSCVPGLRPAAVAALQDRSVVVVDAFKYTAWLLWVLGGTRAEEFLGDGRRLDRRAVCL